MAYFVRVQRDFCFFDVFFVDGLRIYCSDSENCCVLFGSILQKLGKEAIVALVNGIILSAIIYGIAFYFENGTLGLVVSISLFTVIIFAALFGTLIPLVLNHYKIDPALATGPFVTTLNDIVGLFIYFTVGMLLYKM
jgi:magnesium transporter